MSSQQHDFHTECQELGVACACAGLRLDASGPPAYREAYANCKGKTKRQSQSYFVRKWLSLRLSAVKRGMVVDAAVTPAYLGRITYDLCPVTRERLFFDGRRSYRNPSVDRLVNEVSYVAGNICVLSQQANLAKSDMSFDDVVQLAQAGDRRRGLEWDEWWRLACLMYGAWSHFYGQDDPYILPLAAIPRPGMYMSASQAIQLQLTQLAIAKRADPQAIDHWLALTQEGGSSAEAFMGFFGALHSALSHESRYGDAWLHADVFQRFVAWYDVCSDAVISHADELRPSGLTRVAKSSGTPEWLTTGVAYTVPAASRVTR